MALTSIIFLIGFSLLSFFSYHFLLKGFKESYRNFFVNETAILQEILTSPEINTKSALQQEVILEPETNHHKYFVRITDNLGNSFIETPGFNKIIKKYDYHISHHPYKNKLEFIKYKKRHYTLLESSILLSQKNILY